MAIQAPPATEVQALNDKHKAKLIVDCDNALNKLRTEFYKALLRMVKK